eukprot:scaffold7434_cov484-Prasinococcus_capsulatus_cf.AAC.1
MIGRYTHKSTLDILAGNQRDYVAGMSSISSKVVGFNTASASAAAILSEWEKCSLDEACIAPKGTTRKTHRGNAGVQFFKLDELPPHYSPEKTNALKIHVRKQLGPVFLLYDTA